VLPVRWKHDFIEAARTSTETSRICIEDTEGIQTLRQILRTD
jgi:hypothetical protein